MEQTATILLMAPFQLHAPYYVVPSAPVAPRTFHLISSHLRLLSVLFTRPPISLRRVFSKEYTRPRCNGLVARGRYQRPPLRTGTREHPRGPLLLLLPSSETACWSRRPSLTGRISLGSTVMILSLRPLRSAKSMGTIDFLNRNSTQGFRLLAAHQISMALPVLRGASYPIMYLWCSP